MARDTPTGVPPDEADSLYRLPLEEFTTARNGLARELKRSGNSELAEQVRRLRKPTRAAWALNQAAGSKPRLKEGVLEASTQLANAQEKLLRSGDRSAFERARDRKRASVERLMTEVEAQLRRSGGATGAVLDRARKTLEAVGVDEELRQELSAARLTRERETAGFGSLAEVGVAADRERPRKRERARRRLKEAERKARSREGDLEQAQRRLEEARRELHAAEPGVKAAEERLRKARGEADAARAEKES